MYNPERLQKLEAEFLGRDISLRELYQIANRITQLYRQDGYVLSQALVPEQTIRDGVARIQVIEGFVERVDFTGAPQEQLNRLKGFGDKIAGLRPLSMHSLERYLILPAMSEIKITCPRCQSKWIVKNGFIHNGNQNFKCKDCGRQFVQNPIKKVIGQETRELIDKLLLEKLP